jgi:F1F0 ATPase subunit 2
MEMDATAMTDPFSLITAAMAVHTVLGFAFGALLGAAYFQSLWWNVQLITSGSAWRAIGLHLLRFCVLTGSLYAASRYGAVTLISAVFGIIVARSLVLRRARRFQ